MWVQIDPAMMSELREVQATVQPSDTLLVVDAMTGQEAAGLVKAFNEAAEITGTASPLTFKLQAAPHATLAVDWSPGRRAQKMRTCCLIHIEPVGATPVSSARAPMLPKCKGDDFTS